MTAIKLDAGGDLAIVNGALVLVSDLVAETAQRLQIKLRFFLGEWAHNPRIGFPYFEKVLVKNPNIAELRRLYREAIVGDTAVDSLDSLDLDFDGASRTLSVSFEATLNDGSSLVFEDFILTEYAG